MAKADQVVRAILQEILVQESEQQIEAPEAQDAIFAMNNWMTMQDALGVSVGYTFVNDLGDEVTVPDGAIMGVVMNVAMVVAGQFDAAVKNTTAAMADAGLKAMRKLAPGQRPMRHPSTMPVGSGNEHHHGGFRGRHFFPGPDVELLTEQNGSILLEDDTE